MKSKFKQRNNKFNVGDNEPADNLLFMLQNTTILSELMRTKIESFVLGMVSNYAANEPNAKQVIESVSFDLRSLCVYTSNFVGHVVSSMYAVWNDQSFIEKSKN